MNIEPSYLIGPLTGETIIRTFENRHSEVHSECASAILGDFVTNLKTLEASGKSTNYE